MPGPREIRRGEMLPGIPQDSWNLFCQATRQILRLGGPGNGPGASNSVVRVEVEVFGPTVDADFPILKLSEPAFNTDDSEDVIYDSIAFDGIAPDSSTTQGNLAIVQGPCVSGEPRSAVIQGATWADVEFTAESHTHADVKSADNTKLKSASSGITIIWHPTIPDQEYLPATVRCLVMLGGGGGSGVEYVAITETINGATWDVGDAEYDEPGMKTDEEVTVYPFSGGSIDADDSKIVIVGGPLESPITVSGGKFKVGVVIGNDLISVFCAELDLPEDWEET